MKNKKGIIMGIILGVSIVVTYTFLMPVIHEKQCKTRKYEDMESKANMVERSVIGIINENEIDGLKNHDSIGSGVIFKKNEDIYYAITAAHVVIDKESSYKIFTRNTEFKGQVVNINDKTSAVFEIPDNSYYESLLNGRVEYISDTTDLAVISFETNEELPVLEFEDKKIEKGDKILCIGHPEGNRYYRSYGAIISSLKTITIPSKTNNYKSTDKVYEHNAYLNFGNSGGVAISENMKIIGINVGGTFSLTHHFSKGFMIPYDIVKDNINKWQPNIN